MILYDGFGEGEREVHVPKRSELYCMLLWFCKRTNLYDMMDGGSAAGSSIVCCMYDVIYDTGTIRYDTIHMIKRNTKFFKSRVLCFHDALWRQ